MATAESSAALNATWWGITALCGYHAAVLLCDLLQTICKIRHDRGEVNRTSVDRPELLCAFETLQLCQGAIRKVQDFCLLSSGAIVRARS